MSFGRHIAIIFEFRTFTHYVSPTNLLLHLLHTKLNLISIWTRLTYIVRFIEVYISRYSESDFFMIVVKLGFDNDFSKFDSNFERLRWMAFLSSRWVKLLFCWHSTWLSVPGWNEKVNGLRVWSLFYEYQIWRVCLRIKCRMLFRRFCFCVKDFES